MPSPPPATQPPRPLSESLAAVRRRKLAFALTLAACILIAIAWFVLRPPSYSATSKVLVTPRDIPVSVAGEVDRTNSRDAARLAATEAELVRLRAVIAAARERLPSSSAPTDTLRDRVSVSVGVNSDILNISATDTSPDRARALADAVARSYVAFRTDLETSRIEAARETLAAQLQSLRASGRDVGPYYERLLSDFRQLGTLAQIGTTTFTVVETAGEPTQVSPRPIRDTAVALFLSLLIAVLISILVDRIDSRVRDEDELESVLGAPLLGRIALPEDGMPNTPRTLALADSTAGPAAEAFRMLRANFDFTTAAADSRVVLITSALPEAGKSTIAANLAAALAQAGQRVALADLDLRRPTCHLFFNLPRGPGAADVIVGRAGVDQTLVPTAVPIPGPAAETQPSSPVLFLAAGTTAPNPAQLLASPQCARTIDALRESADVVLVDAPPLLVCGDAKTIAPYVDALLLAVPMGSANRRDMTEVARELSTVRPPLLGFVATGSRGLLDYGYYVSAYESHPATPGPAASPRPTLES